MANRNFNRKLAITLGILGAGNMLTPAMSAGLFDGKISKQYNLSK